MGRLSLQRQKETKNKQRQTAAGKETGGDRETERYKKKQREEETEGSPLLTRSAEVFRPIHEVCNIHDDAKVLIKETSDGASNRRYYLQRGRERHKEQQIFETTVRLLLKRMMRMSPRKRSRKETKGQQLLLLHS